MKKSPIMRAKIRLFLENKRKTLFLLPQFSHLTNWGYHKPKC